jgi:hypothetical protein
VNQAWCLSALIYTTLEGAFKNAVISVALYSVSGTFVRANTAIGPRRRWARRQRRLRAPSYKCFRTLSHPRFATPLTRLRYRLTSPMCLAAHGDMMNERRMPAGEKPRAEPEIIPPDRSDRQSRSGGHRRVPQWRWRSSYLCHAVGTTGRARAHIVLCDNGGPCAWSVSDLDSASCLLVAAAIISSLLRAYFRQLR